MKISQGTYVKAVRAEGGTLKALKVKTVDGKQTIRLPKELREIAEKELTVGDLVRVWSVDTQKKKFSKEKKLSKKKKPKLQAVQLIPLDPKGAICAVEKIAAKKVSAKKVTVQLCQKKNCCRRGGDKLWIAFEEAAEAMNEAQKKVVFQVKAGGCVGGCKRGPNLRFLPDNVKHYHVQPAAVTQLLRKHS